MAPASDHALAVKLAAAYAVVAAVGGVLAWRYGGERVFEHPDPWIRSSRFVGASLSALLGVAYAFMIVLGTRATVRRFEWARQLHHELSPIARRLGTAGIVVIAGLSSLGEELVFRAFLQENVGLLAATAIFGAVHQTRGQSRWAWALWATAVGLGLALIYAATGSLAGPLIAHGLVNAVNLTFLKSYDVRLPTASPVPPIAASAASDPSATSATQRA
jgi:hypothetical protein